MKNGIASVEIDNRNFLIDYYVLFVWLSLVSRGRIKITSAGGQRNKRNYTHYPWTSAMHGQSIWLIEMFSLAFMRALTAHVRDVQSNCSTGSKANYIWIWIWTMFTWTITDSTKYFINHRRPKRPINLRWLFKIRNWEHTTRSVHFSKSRDSTGVERGGGDGH